MKWITRILLVILPLSSCSYKISSSQILDIKNREHGIIEIKLRQEDEYKGYKIFHKEWFINYLSINGDLYYRDQEFKAGEVISIPVPAGNLTMEYSILGWSYRYNAGYADKLLGLDIYSEYGKGRRHPKYYNGVISNNEVLSLIIKNNGEPITDLGQRSLRIQDIELIEDDKSEK